jgi:prophage antirepressor-like protein
MASEQLGKALGYATPRVGISNLVTRNKSLGDVEFSGVLKLSTPSGAQETRVFTEDGVYEVTMLARTEKAIEFRAWVRKV